MLQFNRFLSMFLPVARRAQPSTPCSFINKIENHLGFPKIFFPDAALNGLVKKRFFPKKYRVLLKNNSLIKGYNYAECQRKKITHVSDPKQRS